MLDNTRELQANGSGPKTKELGTLGIETFGGLITRAYNVELQWPNAFAEFDNIWRSDPEIGGIVRQTFVNFSRRVNIEVELPDNPSDDDKKARDFAYETLDEAEGSSSLLENMVKTAGYGWSLWETPIGRRDGRNYGYDWQSKYDDGLPTIRGFLWRDQSSFYRWEIDERSGRTSGMWQMDVPNPPVELPFNRCLHLTFGDPENPEGLSPLEAVWRLKMIKTALETILGIGFEHTAGHLSIEASKAVTSGDKSMIENAARAILAAQAGNYALWPEGIKGQIIDSTFQAGTALLESIRYFGLLKLQVYNMQHIAIATTAGTGAYSAMTDARSAAIASFNGMMQGFMTQLDQQIGKRLFDMPEIRTRFPGMTARPKLIIPPIEKEIPLTELSQFAAQLFPLMPVSNEDWIALRRKSEFLPEAVPDDGEMVQQPEPTNTQPDQTAVIEEEPQETPQPDMTPDEIDNMDDMDMALWWRLRQDIYSKPRVNAADLVSRLDDATSNVELMQLREDMSDG